ncbi:SCO1664 family protein [Corynebacterium guangdongense]|uniref:Repeat protein (TIGR03843 family) n=1 Tax=Corynebacterium guangdongense TaxID=1783348 RepID=A0ABU1ZW37_9CORY|nr:SCO1664 family protein [Corynebacterium guangdongense]MDR7328970.1 putative repeat protein (TIGR03843 family) [Corynebacterium guangdongense]WJZ17543.1 Phosphatidylinositol 3- and 4-kinase [Corynebacterium guangdongense]
MNPESLLQNGELGIVTQLVESSNLGFVVDATLGEEYGWGVYKPLMGERPLHDFPPGLHRRERAAYLLSEYLGWGVVPPTVIREDAPFGVGSIQWFIEHEGWHYFPMLEQRPELHPQLKRMAVFDLLANNTDRKSGHVLLDAENHVWGIDQGLCFSVEPKLRTVIWDFAHETIDDELVAAVEPLVAGIPENIAELLDEDEVWALRGRANRIVRLPFLPKPYSQFQYPWPLV